MDNPVEAALLLLTVIAWLLYVIRFVLGGSAWTPRAAGKKHARKFGTGRPRRF